ncbi:MAG: V-type ATP synthase subunit I [Thermodesulfovibrionales bacterium]
MSKVEIVGPKYLTERVLSVLRDFGILHPEPEAIGFIETPEEGYIRSFLLEEKTLSERLYLEELYKKIRELLSMIPSKTARISYLEPSKILDTIERLLQEHSDYCKNLCKEIEGIDRELNELKRHIPFMDAVEKLTAEFGDISGLEITGFIIKDRDRIDHIDNLIQRLVVGRYIFSHTITSDGTIVAVLVTDEKETKRIRDVLVTEKVPEVSLPAFEGLSLKEKIAYLKNRIETLIEKQNELIGRLDRFAIRWRPIYERVSEWIEERLSILKAKSLVFETRMCFFIYGWMPSYEIKRLQHEFDRRFRGQVVIIEKEIRSEDLDRVPVMLKNPPYFKPFEIFTRLLPLPSYTSYDPTVFIGLFFPIFFGMILGDAGYGLLLISISLYMMRRFKGRRYIEDASKILFISSAYSIFFGILYGEFFGELGGLFGLKPLCVERRMAIFPMLYFALTIGVFHVCLGLFLGLLSALRKRAKRELIYRFLNILILFSILTLVAALSGLFPDLLTRPLIIAILILTPLLLFSGGIIAPFEILRSIGNIISYARIMAIGLTSVLLAFVANRIGGLVGNIVMGIFVASLLHILNIVIGIFSPTIHSLRLHYVEFLTKFIEPGGRRYEPLTSRR